MFNIDLRVNRVYPLKNGTTWITAENGITVRTTGDSYDKLNIELIKVGEKGLRSGNVWYIHQDIHGREWVLTDKGAYVYNSKFPSQLPFKWLRGVGEDEFLATEDGKLAKYDLQNRLTMIPMPEGVTRINQLKIQVTNSCWQPIWVWSSTTRAPSSLISSTYRARVSLWQR